MTASRSERRSWRSSRVWRFSSLCWLLACGGRASGGDVAGAAGEEGSEPGGRGASTSSAEGGPRGGDPLSSSSSGSGSQNRGDMPPGPTATELRGHVDVELGGAVSVILKPCNDCHGPTSASLAQAPLLDFEHFGQLIESNAMIPCAAEMSPIVQSLRSGSMPPANYPGVRPTPDEVEVVAEFIDAIFRCSERAVQCARGSGSVECSLTLAEQTLTSYCDTCHSETASSAPDVPVSVAGLLDGGFLRACRSTESTAIDFLDVKRHASNEEALSPPALARQWLIDFVDGLCDEPEPGSQADRERRAIERELSATCGACHTATSDAGVGLAQEFGSLSSLIGSGQLVPCAASKSPLIVAARDPNHGASADAGAPAALSDELLQRLETVVDAPCVEPRMETP